MYTDRTNRIQETEIWVMDESNFSDRETVEWDGDSKVPTIKRNKSLGLSHLLRAKQVRLAMHMIRRLTYREWKGVYDLKKKLTIEHDNAMTVLIKLVQAMVGTTSPLTECFVESNYNGMLKLYWSMQRYFRDKLTDTKEFIKRQCSSTLFFCTS